MPLTRRDFLSGTSYAGMALLTASLETFSAACKPAPNMNKKSDLKILNTSWGYEGPVDRFCAATKKEGFDGVEMWWPEKTKEQEELFAALKQYDLQVGFLCGREEDDYATHLARFKTMINAAARQKVVRPLYINCHSGRDHFGFERNKAFMDHTEQLAKETGIKICHETHRSRILFAAHIARQFIEAIPSLRLTLDISHWCNVHESLLHDQQETVNLALQRVDHIHARIGFPEGPQVNDPRAPEWTDAVNAHLAWWDQVVDLKSKAGETLTILTEFGPFDYMPSVPYTRQPLASQWDINVYMMHLLRKRYPSSND